MDWVALILVSIFSSVMIGVSIVCCRKILKQLICAFTAVAETLFIIFHFDGLVTQLCISLLMLILSSCLSIAILWLKKKLINKKYNVTKDSLVDSFVTYISCFIGLMIFQCFSS